MLRRRLGMDLLQHCLYPLASAPNPLYRLPADARQLFTATSLGHRLTFVLFYAEMKGIGIDFEAKRSMVACCCLRMDAVTHPVN